MYKSLPDCGRCIPYMKPVKKAALYGSVVVVSRSHSGPASRDSIHQLLYCRVGIGYHLQILTNGSVGGALSCSVSGWLGVFAMKPGVVGIRGTKSRLYLCMNEEGIAKGMVRTLCAYTVNPRKACTHFLPPPPPPQKKKKYTHIVSPSYLLINLLLIITLV
uniref:Fibroblast growth factor n=1 Tax=Electrophorus electricus TaxID=8005 RepID=A0AAY5ENG1_ELEEL